MNFQWKFYSALFRHFESKVLAPIFGSSVKLAKHNETVLTNFSHKNTETPFSDQRSFGRFQNTDITLLE